MWLRGLPGSSHPLLPTGVCVWAGGCREQLGVPQPQVLMASQPARGRCWSISGHQRGGACRLAGREGWLEEAVFPLGAWEEAGGGQAAEPCAPLLSRPKERGAAVLSTLLRHHPGAPGFSSSPPCSAQPSPLHRGPSLTPPAKCSTQPSGAPALLSERVRPLSGWRKGRPAASLPMPGTGEPQVQV